MKEDSFTVLAGQALPDLISENFVNCFLGAIIHGCMATCCHCGSPLSEKAAKMFFRQRITSCIACGRKVHIWKNTPLAGAKISPKQIVLISSLSQRGLDTKQVAEVVGISPRTVEDWLSKLEGYRP